MKEKRNSVRNSIVIQGGVLAVAGLLARVIGLVRRIPLTGIIGDVGNGFYAAAYEVYAIILLLSSYSLPLAVSKLVSARISRGQYKNAQKILKGAFIFALISGGLACIFVFIFADWLAGSLMMEPRSATALRVLAPALLVVALMGVLRGYFQGTGNMTPTAISQIVEQIVLVVVSLVGASILFGIGEKNGNLMMNESYGAAMGAAGATLGCVAGGLAGLLFLVVLYIFNRRKYLRLAQNDITRKSESYISVMRIILLTILPVLLSSVIYNVSNVIDQSIYNHYMVGIGEIDLKTFNWGVYSGKYRVLINLPIALANAMCSAIVPSLTASISNSDYVSARQKMATAIKVTMIVSIPSAIGLAVLGKPIVDMLFSGEVDLAAKMLLFGSLSVVFYALSTLGNGILQGINKLHIPVINSVISLGVHIGLLYLMLVVFKWGIFSVIIANLIFSIMMCVLNHLAIRHFIGYKQELIRTFVIPGISSIIMGGAIFGIYHLFILFTPLPVACLIAIIAAVIIYGVLLIVLKGLKKSDYYSIPFGSKLYKLLKSVGIY